MNKMAFNKRFLPQLRRGIPTKVMNVASRSKKSEQEKIRIDKLIKLEKPRILVKRSLGGIGDVIMSLPMLAEIKRLLPNCHLTYMTDTVYANGSLQEVVDHCPDVDLVIHNGQDAGMTFDYSVNITTTGLSREKKKTTPPNRINMFGSEAGLSISNPVPKYVVTKEETEKAKKEIEEIYLKDRDPNTKLIFLQPRSNDARRTWPKHHIDDLTEKLSKSKNIVTLLFDWAGTVNSWTERENLFIIKNRSTADTAAIMKECDLVVCPDSSMLHLGGALNKKIVSIWGPIPPESRINHYQNAEAIVLDLPCQFCVTGESKVLTAQGYKEIKDIKAGEKVMTSSGKLEEVIKVHKNKLENRNLFEITTFGSFKPIVATEDHKVLITKRYTSWKKEDYLPGSRRGIPKFTKPNWVKTKNIKIGDYCCIPIPNTQKIEHPLLKSKDLAWLVGLFIAEGWTNKPTKKSRSYSTQFAISNKETEIVKKIEKIVKENSEIFCSNKKNKGFFSVSPNPKGESSIIKIENKNFVTLLGSLFKNQELKINSKNKFIPIELIFSSNKIIESFLNGAFLGDGYYGEKAAVYSTVNENLAYGMQLLISKLGKVAKVYKYKRDTNFKKDTIIYRVNVANKTDWKRWYKEDNYLYVPVKNIKSSDRKEDIVYDITVKNDPTFTINNIAVYDCWYTPSCSRNSDGSKLACLEKISADMVYDAIIKKLSKPELSPKETFVNKTSNKPILVKRFPRGVGDILMACNGIEALRRKYPHKEIHVAVEAPLIEIIETCPSIDKVLDIHSFIDYTSYSKVFDISNPCSNYESGRLRAGKLVEKNRVEVYADAIGVRNFMSDLLPKYHPKEEELQFAKDYLKDKIDPNKKTIYMVLESAEKYRNWPEENYIKLISLLHEHYNIIISSKKEFSNTINVKNISFREVAALINESDGVFTVDTGPLHVAVALKKKTLALFGPIDSRARCKGYGNLVTIIKSNLPCIPCWRNGNKKCARKDTNEEYSKCLEIISPKQVYKIIKEKI